MHEVPAAYSIDGQLYSINHPHICMLFYIYQVGIRIELIHITAVMAFVQILKDWAYTLWRERVYNSVSWTKVRFCARFPVTRFRFFCQRVPEAYSKLNLSFPKKCFFSVKRLFPVKFVHTGSRQHDTCDACTIGRQA